MHFAGRLFVVCALVVVAQLLVIGIHSGTDPGPASLPRVGPEVLPDSIGDFHAHDEAIDQRLLAAANADLMFNRVYQNRLGDTVFVNAGVWTDYGRGIPHAPNVCYPSAGWDIASRSESLVSLSDGVSLKVKRFVFQRDASRVAVMFWVQLGDETTTDSESIRQLFQKLRVTGSPRPPMVKIMLQTDAVDVGQAQARLSRFAAALYPYTRQIR